MRLLPLLIFTFLHLTVFSQKQFENSLLKRSEYYTLLPHAITYSEKENIRYVKIKAYQRVKKVVSGDSSVNCYGFASSKNPFPGPYHFEIKINGKPFSGILYWTNDLKNPQYIYSLTVENGKTNGPSVIFSDEWGRDVPHKKPVLYLYPTEKQLVTVGLKLTEQKLTYTYPTYKNGWNVIANPDGTLTAPNNNRQYYCLFWETEGKPIVPFIEKGFCVEGKNIATFLEEKLKILGLNDKEANEFIIFWLPQMQDNSYNLIYFAGNEYVNNSQLNISPKPDTQIRIAMVWQPTQEFRLLPEQTLPPTPERKGFVAVEWGGEEVTIEN